MLRRIRMHIRLPLMTALIDLVADGVLRRAQPGAHAHIVVFRDRLVGFLRYGGTPGLALVLHGLDGVSVGWLVGVFWLDGVLVWMGEGHEMGKWGRAYAYLMESILRLGLMVICDMSYL